MTITIIIELNINEFRKDDIKMAFSPNLRQRCWVCTVHIENMKKAGLSKNQYMDDKYVAHFFKELWENSGTKRTAGVVVCMSADNCYHLHMACYGNTTTLKAVASVLYDSHVEPQLGGKEALKEYLLKTGKHADKGEEVLYEIGLESIEDNQGKRNDLDEVEELLNNGATPNEIFETSFRYRKYEKMIKSEYLARRIKETPLLKEMWNEYHWGKAGTGKTYTYYKLCQQYSEDEVYLCNDYSNSGSSGGGFDFYSNNPAKIIVLDEFRGQMSYNQLLSMLDKYSRNQQHCRFQNVYQLWTSVYICTIYPPEKIYSFMVDDLEKNRDTIQQLIRRLNVIVYHYINKEGKYCEFRMPACDYIDADHMIDRAKRYEENNEVSDAVDDFLEVTDTITMWGK